MGDDRKGHLEHHEQGFGNCGGRSPRRARAQNERCIHIHAVQKQTAEVTHIGITVGKGDAVADHNPNHGNQTGAGETLHDSRQHIMFAHHAAIKNCQPRDRHQQNKGG